jgi:riboflavin kinase/FMN adenylyltransferase
MLGRPYSVSGAVVPGYGIGSKKTVPTLNLRTRAELLPANGVYVTLATDLDTGERWTAVTNIGYRPTFKGDALTVESHVLTELGAAEPYHVKLEFLKRLRHERKFKDAASLKAQILKDVGRARAYFRRVRKWVG